MRIHEDVPDAADALIICRSSVKRSNFYSRDDAGDLASALAYAERAARIAPGDPNLAVLIRQSGNVRLPVNTC